MPVNLPDLKKYKKEMLMANNLWPLNPLITHHDGLLSKLPITQGRPTGWPWTEQVDPLLYSQSSCPKFTIVTPSYNQAAFLEQTIRSVLLQNYPNLEYIVIDGGSDDGSKEILEKYSPWISYWQSKKDNGQSHAVNLGFSIASGDYFAWLNSDDYYLPKTFATVINAFIKTKASFVYGYSLNYNVYTKTFETVKPYPVLDYFLRFSTLAQPSCFWSSKIHQPLWEELHCSLDYELWLRMVKGNSRKLIKQPLSVANVHGDAKTHDPNMGLKWRRDHELICSDDAYGPVRNWWLNVRLNKAWGKLSKLY